MRIQGKDGEDDVAEASAAIERLVNNWSRPENEVLSGAAFWRALGKKTGELVKMREDAKQFEEDARKWRDMQKLITDARLSITITKPQ